MAGLSSGATKPTPLQNSYSIYNNAVKQNAGDYSGLMSNYSDIINGIKSGSYNYKPSLYSYSPSSNVTSSLNNLSDLSKTGGYSPANIADIRARAISPIRSVYANARANLDRSKALQGGYSPNYTAATAKMARDLSSQLADTSTNVNAELAQNIAGNRIASAPAFASAAGAESALANEIGLSNANATNEANKFNIQLPLEAMQGATSLYGTTPALSSTFGNQALNSAQLQAMIDQYGKQNNLQLIGTLLSSLK